MRLAIPITYREQKTIRKQGKAINAKPIHKQEAKVSQIHTNIEVPSVLRSIGREKEKTGCNKNRNMWGKG